MQIKAISNPQNYKNTNIKFKGVVKNVLKESSAGSAQEFYRKNANTQTTDPWDTLSNIHANYSYLNDENMGISLEEAKRTFPRIILSSQNRLQLNIKNLKQYKKDYTPYELMFPHDKKLENTRYYAQEKLLSLTIEDLKKSQKLINEVMTVFSGHLPDENKAKMIDAALDAKRAHKKTSKPILIKGKYYTSSLSTRKEGSIQNDYLTITRVKDGLTMIFRQHDTKHDFDFMLFPQMYGQNSKLNFDLVEVQTKNTAILCGNATQTVEKVFRGTQFDEKGNGFCKRAAAIENRLNGKLYISQNCFVKDNTLKDSLFEYSYDIENGRMSKMRLKNEVYEFDNGWKKAE